MLQVFDSKSRIDLLFLLAELTSALQPFLLLARKVHQIIGADFN